MHNGTDIGDFFQHFFQMDPSTGGANTMPRDDGNLPHPDDELLPEERLRQEEQNAATPSKPPTAPKSTPAKKKPVIESIRI